MKNKILPALLAMMIVMGAIAPFASASTETGVGPHRTVVLMDHDWYTNATVVVPEIICNETNNSFLFVFTDESGVVVLNYTINMTVEYNGTYYNKTVSVTVPTNGTIDAYINYTADELPLGDLTVNLTLWWDMGWMWMDDWNGTIESQNALQYNVSTTMPQLFISILGMAVVIMLLGKFLGSINKTIKKD